MSVRFETTLFQLAEAFLWPVTVMVLAVFACAVIPMDPSLVVAWHGVALG